MISSAVLAFFGNLSLHHLAYYYIRSTPAPYSLRFYRSINTKVSITNVAGANNIQRNEINRKPLK